MKNRVGCRGAFAVRDHGAVAAALNRAVPGRPAIEQRVHDAGAARIGEKARAKADQAARRHVEF